MAAYIDAVKDGKFYHVYGHGTSKEKWVYVRAASGAAAQTAAAASQAADYSPGAPAAVKALPPGVTAPPPPPTPFFSADDLMSSNNFWTQWNTTFSDLDSALAKLKNDSAYSQAQLDETHRDNGVSIADNAAARGLSQSSIKDGQVAKETTDYTRTTNHNRDTVRNFETDVAGKKNYFETVTKPQFQSAMNQKAVENAMAASYNAPPPPTAGGTPAAAPTQASGGYRNVVKGGKFYHVFGYGTPQEKWRFIRNAS